MKSGLELDSLEDLAFSYEQYGYAAGREEAASDAYQLAYEVAVLSDSQRATFTKELARIEQIRDRYNGPSDTV